MKILLHFCILAFIPLSALLLISCDNSYDLRKDINTEINIGGKELAIPIGTTEKIVLDKMLNITSESSVEITKNGDYYITMKGDNAPTQFTTPVINIKKIEPIFDPFTFNKITTKSIQLNRAPSSINLSFNTPTPATFTIKSDIPKEVVSFSSAKFKKHPSGSSPSITLSIDFSGFPTDMKSINLTNLTFVLPDKMTYNDPEINGNILSTSEKINISGGKGTFVKVLQVYGIKLADGDKIITESDGRKSLTVDQQIDISGTINVVPTSNNTLPDINLLRGKPSVVFTGATIKTVTGVIDIDIDPINMRYKTEFPSFLTEGETYLDLINALVVMNISNGAPAKINSKAFITSYKNNTQIDGAQLDMDISVKPGETTAPTMSNFWVSHSNKSMPQTFTWIDQDISSILKHTPDVIKIKVEPKTTSDPCTVELGRVYELKLDYHFFVPLMLGEKLTIDYNEDLTNVQKELTDIIDKIDHIILDVKTDNHIPLNMKIEPKPLDGNGNILDGITMTIDGDIKSAQKDTESTTGTKGVISNSQITIKESRKGALKEMNTIRLRIIASSDKSLEGIMLNEKQFL
ncbi:MAG: hypothetical protein RR141_01280 [Rikenellaceae bacterium]